MYAYLLGYIDFGQVKISHKTGQGVGIIHSIVKLLLINIKKKKLQILVFSLTIFPFTRSAHKNIPLVHNK